MKPSKGEPLRLEAVLQVMLLGGNHYVKLAPRPGHGHAPWRSASVCEPAEGEAVTPDGPLPNPAIGMGGDLHCSMLYHA